MRALTPTETLLLSFLNGRSPAATTDMVRDPHLAVGNLSGAIASLMQDGWVTIFWSDPVRTEGGAARRRLYGLTETGLQRAADLGLQSGRWPPQNSPE